MEEEKELMVAHGYSLPPTYHERLKLAALDASAKTIKETGKSVSASEILRKILKEYWERQPA